MPHWGWFGFVTETKWNDTFEAICMHLLIRASLTISLMYHGMLNWFYYICRIFKAVWCHGEQSGLGSTLFITLHVHDVTQPDNSYKRCDIRLYTYFKNVTWLCNPMYDAGEIYWGLGTLRASPTHSTRSMEFYHLHNIMWSTDCTYKARQCVHAIFSIKYHLLYFLHSSKYICPAFM